MQNCFYSIVMFCVFMLLAGGGCEFIKSDANPAVFSYADFTPVEIHIMPLTEVVVFDENEIDETPKINAYVILRDGFDSQIKWPAVFRFELYEKALRSADPKGKRIAIWPDVDLTGPVENGRYWRDFLRAYRFDLDFEGQAGHSYILHISSLLPGGKRLWTDFELEPAE